MINHLNLHRIISSYACDKTRINVCEEFVRVLLGEPDLKRLPDDLEVIVSDNIAEQGDEDIKKVKVMWLNENSFIWIVFECYHLIPSEMALGAGTGITTEQKRILFSKDCDYQQQIPHVIIDENTRVFYISKVEKGD